MADRPGIEVHTHDCEEVAILRTGLRAVEAECEQHRKANLEKQLLLERAAHVIERLLYPPHLEYGQTLDEWNEMVDQQRHDRGLAEVLLLEIARNDGSYAPPGTHI